MKPSVSIMMMFDRVKPCYSCKEILDIGAFCRDASRADGRQPKCKSCHSAYIKRTGKTLTRSYRAKALAASKRRRDANLIEARSKQNEYRLANRERFNRKRADHMARDPEYFRALRLAYMASPQGRAKVYAKNAERRAARIRAVPQWADQDKIKKIYHDASMLTAETGQDWHVDHIVPLKSPIVCGLHCEANLQILPGRDNLAKGNRYWPDMPT